MNKDVKKWDPTLFDYNTQYAANYGKDVIALLAPRQGETIIDLGCGTGDLTAKIQKTGATVRGIDSSADMIEEAKQDYPDLLFEVADGESFHVEDPVDAVFSNASLHWMTNPENVIASVSRALKPGGRFVGEMGGKENIATIIAALNMAFVEIGQEPMPQVFPWYFPSLGEYASLLEKHGFVVEQAAHFKQPLPVANGAEGLKSWIQNFADPLLKTLTPEEKEFVLDRTITFAEPALADGEQWYADYVHIRFRAFKEE